MTRPTIPIQYSSFPDAVSGGSPFCMQVVNVFVPHSMCSINPSLDEWTQLHFTPGPLAQGPLSVDMISSPASTLQDGSQNVSIECTYELLHPEEQRSLYPLRDGVEAKCASRVRASTDVPIQENVPYAELVSLRSITIMAYYVTYH